MRMSAEIRGIQNVEAALSAARKRHKKNLETAVKVEGFAKMRLLQKEIRQGRPGGQQMAPLTFIGSTYTSRTSRGNARGRRNRNRPLSGLSQGVRYYIPQKQNYEVHIGFVGPQFSVRRSLDDLAGGYMDEPGFTKGTISSTTWRRLAKMHQEGFVSGLRYDFMPKIWAREGGKLSKRTRNRKYFFLKKSTKRFKTPARKIIDPFKDRYRSEMLRNIQENFRRKSRGERI